MSQDFYARTVACFNGSAPGRISVRLPGGEPFETDLRAETMVVGRGQDADLILDQTSVSRRHASLEIVEGRLRVRDLGSANGVELNGRRVGVAELEPGQSVRLGEVEITLLCLAATAAPPPPPAGLATQVQAGAEPRPAPSGKGKRLVLVGGISAAAVVLLIVLVSFMGGGQPGPPAEPPPAKPEAQPATAPAAQTTAAAPATPPPAAATDEAQGRLQAGQLYYEAGRLPDAAQEWRRALELDPGLEIARIRLARVEQEIMQVAEEDFRIGLQSFNYLNYELAIQHWQRVLNLVQDPNAPLHQKTVEYLAQARAKLGR